MSSLASSVASSSQWISRASLLTTPSKFPKFQSCSPPPPPPSCCFSCSRLVCRAESNSQSVGSDPKFVLHEALESSGIDTSHAREAREGFCAQIRKLSDIERETSITINRCVDLGKTALYIAAEDDSLVSHSSVPLPVDAFIERLDDLSVGYCSQYNSSYRSSPDKFLESLERYLYGMKGFRRTHSKNQAEPRALYLHSVLTHRSGSIAMLSLIYSEVLKMLRLWGLVNFDVEIFFPHDLHSLPRGYDKQKSKDSDQPHIITSQMLLVEILRNLKNAFWPFQHDHTRSLFLWAAHAANCIDRSNIGEESGFQIASAKAAQHRLERGVWTSVRFGDMRRALSMKGPLQLVSAVMAEGTRSYAQVVDSLNTLRQQQDRHQKQLEDTIAVLVQQQETARIDRENQDKRFAEVMQQISKISVNGSIVQEEMHEDSEEVPGREQVDKGIFRHIKVEFPRFSGGNPVAWVYKANQYFLYHQVPPGQRIFFASFYMEEEALVWFQNSSEAGLFRSWDEFTQALQVRFSLSVYDDPMEALTRLKQVSTVAAYKTEFDFISNRLKGISEKNKLSCFISGLKDEVRFTVKMFNPKNLNDAFGLAKIQEQNIWSTRKVWKNTSYDSGPSIQKPIQTPSILGAPPQGQAISKMPFQRISEHQMQERRKKGLCYFCEEKYYQGHKCAKPRVYVLEGMDLSQMESCELEEETEQSEGKNTQQMKEAAGVAAISVQALVGTPSPKTMRVLGHIKKRQLIILIDSGSTHNFVDTVVARKCGLAIQQSDPLQVRIANGDMVASEGKCGNVALLIQGTTFVSDLLTLDLGGCDIVLGVQWLLSLGPILWDFAKLSMQFTYKGVLTSLKALPSTSSNLVDDVEVTKISAMESKGFFLQITAVQSQEVLHDIPQDVLKLLDRF